MFTSITQAALVISFATSAYASCARGTSLFPRAEGAIPAATFGYSGTVGPTNWFALDTAKNSLCSSGKNQSPIDAKTGDKEVISGAAFKLDVPAVEAAVFENLGTTVEVIVNGSFTHSGETFTLKQFHFHTPSEHRIDDEFAVMEMHFVTQSSAGVISVAGFPIELGATDPFFTSVFENLDKITAAGTETETGPLDFTKIASHLATNDVYRYGGSLTTPPCSEGVEWVFSMKPLTIDQATFTAVKSVVGFNSRFLQADIGTTNLLAASAATISTAGADTGAAAKLETADVNQSAGNASILDAATATGSRNSSSTTTNLVAFTGAASLGPRPGVLLAAGLTVTYGVLALF